MNEFEGVFWNDLLPLWTSFLEFKELPKLLLLDKKRLGLFDALFRKRKEAYIHRQIERLSTPFLPSSSMPRSQKRIQELLTKLSNLIIETEIFGEERF